jgi:predicted ATPase
MVTAALLTPRPPQLVVLNEPEQSMHPSLLPALARTIARAARSTQVVVVTHSADLAGAVAAHGEEPLTVELAKTAGETVVVGQDGPLDRPAWRWP